MNSAKLLSFLDNRLYFSHDLCILAASMKTQQLLFMCLFVIGASGAGHLQAQQLLSAVPYESDILSARPVRILLGIGPGAMRYSHGGSFSPSCDCVFSDGDGYRFHFAGELLVQYPKVGFAYGVMLSYYDVTTEFSREESRNSVVVGENDDVVVDYRNTSNVPLRWLSITPEVLWYLPRSGLFVQAGVEFGLPGKATYDHREIILTDGITYYNGEVENVLLEESDIPGGDGLRLALALGVGYEIQLGTYVSVTPRFGANLPLTPVSTADEEWHVTTMYTLVMLQLRV